MRYSPRREFPAYAFLPGRDPHPTRDPGGHSFDVDEESAEYFSPERWRENDDYLFGVDLYNHGYLWEAHEAWEGLWHAAKSDELQAFHLQGLIQCAAACLKIPMEQPRGLERLSQLGTGKLLKVARGAGPHYMGLDIERFVARFVEFAARDGASIEDRPRIELSDQERA